MAHKRLFFLGAALLLLAVEVIIALFVHDAVIRPYGGDVIVVVFVWCAVRAVIPEKFRFLWLFVFLFACFVEFTQYIKLVSLLGLENNRFFSVLLGTSFSWTDIACYALGTVPVALHDMLTAKRKTETR